MSSRRLDARAPWRRLALALLIAGAIPLLCAGGAQAALTHPFLGAFGPEGVEGANAKGAFGAVKSVAVDPSTGDVYVFDEGKAAIFKFNAAGEPVKFSGLAGNVIEHVESSGGGAEQQIAVDGSAGPDKGDIYLANNHSVDIWGEDGKPLEAAGKPVELSGHGEEACGVAVDTSGVVYVGFFPETVVKYTPVTNPVTDANETASMAGLKSVCNVAVDGEGNVFAATYFGGVNEYEPLQFGSLEATGTVIDEESGNALAADAAIAHRVYIDEQQDIAEYDTSGTPARLGVSGSSEPGALSGSLAVAAAGTAGSETLYASSATSGGVINRYGPAALVPGLALDEATNLKTASVTLNGTVNPESKTLAAEYQFEYGTSTAYGQRSPASPTSVGTGEAPVPVTAALTGLEPNTAYHYRLNAINTNGTNHSPDHTFTTPGPPRIQAEAAEPITQTGATLNARLSADGFQTTYHFEYGETSSYGSSTTAGKLEPEEAHTVSAAITGLKAGAVYHFRLVATSEVEGKLETVTGEDREFTTLAAAPIASESVSGLAPTAVQLAAQINPLGNDTHAYFQYGSLDCAQHPESCTDTPSPPGADLGSGSGDQLASADLTGLTPETTYHYRVIASNTLGTTEGPDQTFTTYAAPTPSGGCPNEQLRGETLSARLPDCRVYELVSPAVKNGNFATVPAAANPSGTGIAYWAAGPLVPSPAGNERWAVSLRSAAGWRTRATLPRVQEQVTPELGGAAQSNPSRDLSHFYFNSEDAFAAPPDLYADPNIFIEGENPFLEPEWIGRPTIEHPEPPLNSVADTTNSELAGGSPDFSTLYFAYSGTLVKEDEPRASNPAFQAQIAEYLPNASNTDKIWGLYEWKDKAIRSAAILPDGTTSPWGAMPAAAPVPRSLEPDTYNNQVSVDGSRAFFVSPDPQVNEIHSGAGDQPCRTSGYETEHPGGCVPQLYVRLNGERTELVSLDALTSKAGEPPEPAPHGPLPLPTSSPAVESEPYVFASPDGSHAFFESHDILAKSAGGQEPSGAGPFTYDFDVDTGALAYLPGVVGPILAAATDGSRFVFHDTVTNSLELWSAASPVATIAALPQPERANDEKGEGENGRLVIAPTRMTADGSIVAFETDSPLPGAFNNGGGWMQVYRYEVATDRLDCVSCPPHGVVPSGDAHLSEDDGQPGFDSKVRVNSWVSSRGLTSDGSRVFFDTPDPLVAQDANHRRDVYEWHSATLSLISSGTSLEDSYFLDNSESGEDAFLMTSQGLSPPDKDGAYDVYDARMGVLAGPSPPACSGTGCQGVPAPPPAFSTPASATFAGAGNSTPAAAPKPGPPTRSQRLAKALKACHALRRARRRRCEADARRRFRARRARRPSNRADAKVKL